MTIHLPGTDSKSSAVTMDYGASESQSTIGIVDHASNQTHKLVKMISLTLLGVTAILGCFILAAVFVQSSNKCVCRYGEADGSRGPYFEPLTAASNDEEGKMRRVPIQIQMDGEAGDLMRRNKKGEVKCSVERKTAVQIIASEPKLLMTPYGNITTDPRLIHMTGEKMVITCGSNDKPKKKSKKSSGSKTTDDTKEPIDATEIREKRDASEKAGPVKKECACDCSC